jgi:hypothetical protein
MAGSTFYYRWEVKSNEGPKEVIGGSIDMAASIFRAYGNCAMEINCNETPSHYFFTAVFIDLESGMSWPRMFRQRKSQSVSKRMEADRQEDIVFQIGQSKAMRNAVLSVMPRWVVDRAIQKAREAEIQRLSGRENIAIARAEVLKYFGRFGVSAERIEAKIGKKMEDTEPADLADLRSVATAIKDGLTTVSEAFPPVEDKPEPAATGAQDPPPPMAPPAPAPPAPSPGPTNGAPQPPGPEPAPPPTSTAAAPADLAPSGNPFDDTSTWKNFKSKSDGMSSFYFKNRKFWPSATAAAKRAFAEKWSKLYPVNPFPGELPQDPPGADSHGNQAAFDRETKIMDLRETFSLETLRAAKQRLGFAEGDGTWPPSAAGLELLEKACLEIETI